MDPVPPRRNVHRRRALLALLVVAVAAGGYGWWKQWGRHLYFPKNFGVVEAGRIYRSGLIHERLVEKTLRENRIATIVDLSGEGMDNPKVAAERVAAERLGARALEVNGLGGDGSGDVSAYVAALTEMAHATPERPVLVHCAGGSERTGAAVAFYRMLFEGWDGRRAYDEYLSYRGDPPKNDALPQYVNAVMPDLVKRLRENDTLSKEPASLPVFGPEGFRPKPAAPQRAEPEKSAATSTTPGG